MALRTKPLAKPANLSFRLGTHRGKRELEAVIGPSHTHPVERFTCVHTHT